MPKKRKNWNPEDKDRLFRLCLLGLGNVEIAKQFDVSESRFYEWMNEHPEIKKIIKSGRDDADAKVAASCYESANGYYIQDTNITVVKGEVFATPYMRYVPKNITAQIFWLKNRQREQWADRKDVNVSGELNLNQMTDEELEIKRKTLEEHLKSDGN